METAFYFVNFSRRFFSSERLLGYLPAGCPWTTAIGEFDPLQQNRGAGARPGVIQSAGQFPHPTAQAEISGC